MGYPGNETLQAGPQGGSQGHCSPRQQAEGPQGGQRIGENGLEGLLERRLALGAEQTPRPGALGAREFQDGSGLWRLGSWAGVRREAGALRVISEEAKGTPFVMSCCVFGTVWGLYIYCFV